MFATALVRTFRQLGEPVFLKVLAGGLVLAVVSWALSVWAAGAFVDTLYQSDRAWVNMLVKVAAGLLALWLGFLVFVPLSALFIGLFLDPVVDAVEARFYPDRRAGPPLGVWASLGLGLRLGLVMIVVNALALPLYLLVLWVPGLPVLLFWVLNAYLLGWGFYDLVAPRHLSAAAARGRRRAMRPQLFVAGLLVTLLFTVPLVNLAAPIIGAALMVHIFHGNLMEQPTNV